MLAVTVGVPVMAHVLAVKLRPVGREGEMAHVAPLTAPDGLIVHVMSGLKEVLRVMNAPSALGVSVQLSSSVKVVLVDPPLLLAYTVYVASSNNPVGIPQTLPLVLPKLRPDGSEGTMTHEVTAPPVTVGETVVMVRSLEMSMVDG